VSAGYLYILTNDGLTVLYTGWTSDLRKRVLHHKHRLIPGFTKKYNVHRLVYFEVLLDIEAARRREREVKGINRARKKALINAVNPLWRELYEEIVSEELVPKETSDVSQGDPSRCSG
jgi:putative endonuclease